MQVVYSGIVGRCFTYIGVIKGIQVYEIKLIGYLKTERKQKISRFQAHQNLFCRNYFAILSACAVQRENHRPDDLLCVYLNIPVFDLH